ncbi:hypothetical protein DFP73DRAFT_529084 [Morchella snyderi]|nr:hypothetical protein DFP73DRAFT_529084 [Morchella snyderi]
MPPPSPRPPSYRPIPPPRDHHSHNTAANNAYPTPPAYPSRLSIPPPPYVRGPQPPLPPTPPPAQDPADRGLPPPQWGIRLVAAPADRHSAPPASPQDPPSPLLTAAAFSMHERPLPPLPAAAPTHTVADALRRAINDMRPLPPLPGSERPLPPPPPSRGGGDGDVDVDVDVDVTPLLPPLPGARERVPGMVGQLQRGPTGRKKSWQGELGRVGVGLGLGCGFGTGGRGKGRRAVSSGC